MERTIIRNIADDSIVMFDSRDIFAVYHLDNSEDNTWLYDEDEDTLVPTSGWYSEDDLCGLRVVAPVGSCWSKDGTDYKVVNVLNDALGNEDTEAYVDVTNEICFSAKAVDMEHGINVERIVFDEEDPNEMSWETLCELHDVKMEIVQKQNYPHEQNIVEYTGYDEDGNKMVVREYNPFFPDDTIPTYELVPLRDITGDIVVRFEWKKHVGYARKFLGIEKVKASDACHDESLICDDDLVYEPQYMSVLSADVAEECEKDDTLEQVLLDDLVNGRDMKWSNQEVLVKAIEEFCKK